MHLKARLISNAEQPVGWVIGFIITLAAVGYMFTSLSGRVLSPILGAVIMGFGSAFIFGIGVYLKRKRDRQSGEKFK